MTADLAASCADLARWLPVAAALITEPDADGITGGGQRAASACPPWNAAAASAYLDAHEGARRLEASLRRAVTGRTGRRRGGSSSGTTAAIAAIEALGNAVLAADANRAARHLDRWTRAIQELPAVDEAEPWRRVSAPCPYCGFHMLRVAPRSGQVTCLRHGACRDADGHHPVGRMDVSRLTGDPVVRWADGLVAP